MVFRRPHPTHCRRSPGRGAGRSAAACAAVALAAALLTGRAGVRRVVVAGPSMLPALLPGDRLVVVRPWPLRVGQLVAVRDPRATERLMVKRVAAVGSASVEVRGDNAAASTDSRHYGPVARSLVEGRVVYRYFPAARLQWWP